MLTAHAVIDLDALRHNMAQVRRYAPHSQVLAVIKANGYGHGALAVAEALAEQADAFAVARLEEALKLRKGGIELPIVLLEGVFDPGELGVAAAHGCQLGVHSLSQLETLERAHLHQPVTVWLKVDTGMHRLGVEPEQFQHFYQRLLQTPSVNEIVLMSHFASADEPETGQTQAQLAEFQRCCQGLSKQPLCSLANSAAIINEPLAQRDWVRPGIMLYGASPFAGRSAASLGLKPAMTLKSRVIAVRDLKAGGAVGYGASWTAEQDTRLAVVAMGYGDGYPRHVPNQTPVLINGVRYPIVGRVSMDMITVDIGDAEISEGDEVVLWGSELSVDEIAALSGTLGYELLCNVTSRVVYHYQNGAA
ncbi:alanine racemase [Corallincola holothuriorum]|uniref:Alanine racemase n=1 Tax=Corallincola holothuriorum TaxID=2282215 RepID=A0A368NMC0_9GAMM|nr:alanine racemase [Corallincola holothuriorum]RCU51558.1 alanine racemase [Corallincola holothuriorum]